jgi:hypothetical protein
MMTSAASSWKAATIITLLFAAAGVFGILHHEIWLDEAHHWLLARDSATYSEMITNARYEGHPLLWNSLLFILSRFYTDPLAMQVMNVCISAIAVFLFLKHAPFSFFQKLLVVFSYFIFYEYTIISRNYSLAFLFLVIVCILYEKRREKFLLFSISLALLSQTHLFAAIISFSFLLFSCYEFYHEKRSAEKKYPHYFIPGCALILLSLILVIFQSIPPRDHFIYTYDTDPLFSVKRLGKGFSVLWKGLFPVPDLRSAYPWNSNLVIGYSKLAGAFFSLLAWFIPFVLLFSNKKALYFYYVTAICIVVFLYFSPLIVASRYCGFFFLLLLVVMWITNTEAASQWKENKIALFFDKLSSKIANGIFIAILISQVISSAYLFFIDLNRPFSNGKFVAEWLMKNTDPKKIIVVNDHFAGPSVSAYFGKKVYYAENNAEGSFCKWNTSPFMISPDTLLHRISLLLDKSPERSLWVVTNKPLRLTAENEMKIRLVINFSGALVKAENYWIYELSRPWKKEEIIQ